MELTDREFRSLKQGDVRIFERIYVHYRKKIYTYLLIKSGQDSNVADDVFSDTIHSALESVSKIRDKKKIYSWLLQIAQRRFSDYLRRKYREKKYRIDEEPDQNESSGENIVVSLIEKEKYLFFQLTLEHITPKYRQLLEWKYIENLSQKVIAERIAKKETAVEGLLFRAREAFKREFKRLYRGMN